jgi:hypothetical protein
MAIEIAPPEIDLPDPRKRRREIRALWRLSAWGGTAAIALAAVAITTQTDSGSARLQTVLAQESQPARTVILAAVKPRVIDPDTLRLEAQVRVLTADRDRLTARIASLEHNLDDMTGSIKRQAVQIESAAAAKTPAQAPSPPVTTPAQIVAAAPAPSAPAVSPTPPASNDTAEPSPATPPAQAATAEPVPLPPVRVATAPASEPAAEPQPPRKPELGIDIGGASNTAVLSARWAAVKANFGPLLTGLRPLAAHNPRPGATDYRLVVGPLPNAAAAAQLCTRFIAARVNCRSAKFDGETLALR